MQRKIIQIATDAHPQADGGIYALCDDGTVWKLNYLGSVTGGKTAEWRQIKPVPQSANLTPIEEAMMSDQETEEMMERTFMRACEYAASMEISVETALTHFLPQTAIALGAYIAHRAPELLAQRSPYKDFINQGSALACTQQNERLIGGQYHPGDEA